MRNGGNVFGTNSQRLAATWWGGTNPPTVGAASTLAQGEMRRIVIALALCLWAASASAQSLFTMDLSSGAQEHAGWDAITGTGDRPAKWDMAFVTNGWASGLNGYRLFQNYTGEGAPFYGGQFSWGWYTFVAAGDPARGVARYYRWRQRFSSTTNFQAADPVAPSLVSNKILMVGNTCTDAPCRVIVNYVGDPCWCRASHLRIQIDGGENPGTTPFTIPVNTDLNIQVEIVTATTGSSANGGYKLWMNNNTYASPDATVQRIQLNPDNHRLVALGAYENGGLYVTGVHEFMVGGFEVATTFDSAWNAGGATPTKYRLRQPAIVAAAPIGFFLWRRRRRH